jgi:hypothetical protein
MFIDRSDSMPLQLPEHNSIDILLKRIEEQQQSHLETLKQVHEALSGNRTTSEQPTINQSVIATVDRNRAKRRREVPRLRAENDSTYGSKPITLSSEVLTGESEDSDIEEEYYVQRALPSFKFDREDLLQHLKTYNFNSSSERLLETVVKHGRLAKPVLFSDYPPTELYHNSHYSIFNVGRDGAPLSRSEVVEEGSSIDSAIWQALRVYLITSEVMTSW